MEDDVAILCRAGQGVEVSHVSFDDLEIAGETVQIRAPAARKVVEDADRLSFGEAGAHQMGAHEHRSTRHEGAHCSSSSSQRTKRDNPSSSSTRGA